MTTCSVRAATAVLVALVASACSGGASRPEGAAVPKEAAVEERWRWVAPPPASVGMPGADDHGIAVTYGRHWLVSLDGDGRPRWTVAHGGLRDVKPLLTPELVVAPTEQGLAAFDRADGHLRWVAELGERANTPVVSAGRAVTSTWEGSLVAVDLRGGGVAWRAPLPGGALGPPGGDGQLVVTSWEADDGSSAGAVAVDAATGRRRWEAGLEPGGVSAPAVSPAAGTVVVVAGDIAAHGLALDSGAARWRAELEGAGSPEVPPLALAAGGVLVAHRLGGLALVDGRNGRVGWRASSDGAAVRGGPAGPGPDGRFALPLDDGRLLLAGPDSPAEELDPPGRVSGVAAGPGHSLLAATRESSEDNTLSAFTGW